LKFNFQVKHNLRRELFSPSVSNKRFSSKELYWPEGTYSGKEGGTFFLQGRLAYFRRDITQGPFIIWGKGRLAMGSFLWARVQEGTLLLRLAPWLGFTFYKSFKKGFLLGSKFKKNWGPKSFTGREVLGLTSFYSQEGWTSLEIFYAPPKKGPDHFTFGFLNMPSIRIG